MISNRTARTARAVLLAVMLATSGCASIPKLGPEPQPRTASDFVADKSFAAPRSEWPADGWWLRYGDSQLARLMEEALVGSPDLAAAVARLRAADGFAQRAHAARKPQVNAFAVADQSNVSQNGFMPSSAIPDGWNDSGAAGLSFFLDLDLWGRNRAAARAADADADAARYEFDEARLVLTTGIATTYADLASLHARRDSLEDALEIRTRSAKLVTDRVTIGLDTLAEQKQVEARISQVRADIEELDEAIALTRNALAALVGAGPDRGLSIGRPTITTLRAQGIPADASINLVGRRPDIATSRARVEAAAQRIKESRAAFYPNVSLSALIGLQSFGLGNLLAGSSSFGSVSPALTLPLFNGGALQGQYRGRRGQYDEAVALYDGQVIQALRQTADAVTSQRMLARRLGESRSALAAFREAHGLARLRYEKGLATYLDVLSAEEGVVRAQLQVAQLETRAFTLDVQLVRALGGGFTAA
jgi:NodT family efflux transporter outer membrane factor (OMF) lipoprotein